MRGNIFQAIMEYYNRPDTGEYQRIKLGIGHAVVGYHGHGSIRQARKARRKIQRASQRKNRR